MEKPTDFVDIDKIMQETCVTKMTIAGRAFLSSERRTVRVVHVQNDLFDRLRCATAQASVIIS